MYFSVCFSVCGLKRAESDQSMSFVVTKTEARFHRCVRTHNVISFTDHWSIIALTILIREGFFHLNLSLLLNAYPWTRERKSEKHIKVFQSNLSMHWLFSLNLLTFCIIFYSNHYWLKYVKRSESQKSTYIIVKNHSFFILNSTEV